MTEKKGNSDYTQESTDPNFSVTNSIPENSVNKNRARAKAGDDAQEWEMLLENLRDLDRKI